MKTVDVWADSIQAAFCRGCRRQIWWTTVVKSGARLCFDQVDRLLEAMVNQRQVVTLDLEKNHWATCPNRDQFRRKGGR